MSRTITSVALAALLALCLAGCSGTDTAPPTTGAAAEKASPTSLYWPLKLNYQWAYRYLTYDDTSATRQALQLSPELQPAAITFTTMTSKIVSKMADSDGLQWFVLRTTVPGLSTQTAAYRHTAGGMMCSVDQVPAPYYLIKAPLQAGQIWNMTGVIYRRIMSTTATVNTPYGAIPNCIYIKQTYNSPSLANLVVKYWYARNIGLVRWEIRDDGLLTRKCELKSHNVVL